VQSKAALKSWGWGPKAPASEPAACQTPVPARPLETAPRTAQRGCPAAGGSGPPAPRGGRPAAGR